jgi:hypothetical protein
LIPVAALLSWTSRSDQGWPRLMGVLRVEPVVLTFNPWMFSGREQLVARFFEQVAALHKVGGRLQRGSR